MSRLVTYHEPFKKTVKQGGLSDEVWSSYHLKDYLTGPVVAGYIGSSNRTIKYDKMLENALRKTGLGKEGIADWLTSGSGRHLMDDPGKNLNDFKERVENYTKDAFQDVTIWNHPDHEGTFGSSMRLEEKITNAFSLVKAHIRNDTVVRPHVRRR